jgi:hypothetical protein
MSTPAMEYSQQYLQWCVSLWIRESLPKERISLCCQRMSLDNVLGYGTCRTNIYLDERVPSKVRQCFSLLISIYVGKL